MVIDIAHTKEKSKYYRMEKHHLYITKSITNGPTGGYRKPLHIKENNRTGGYRIALPIHTKKHHIKVNL